MPTDIRAPLVSVIVPVRNGAEDLRGLLECLERQTLARDNFEIVIADDGSIDDGTKSLETADGRVRVTYAPPANSYAARNRAVANSTAPVLAFCDADCRPEAAWLDEGLKALGDADIVAGRIRLLPPERLTPWSLIDMESAKDHEHAVRNGVAETANLFLRRELFEDAGGFDDTLPEHGDFDFVERCVAGGATLTFGAESVVWHPVRTSALAVMRAMWKYNRWYATRVSRARQRPSGVNLREWVPLVQTIRGRRRVGRSLGPDQRWLGQNGVTPSRREIAQAVPFMYLVMPYLRAAAQLRGWWDGRRLRRAWEPGPSAVSCRPIQTLHTRRSLPPN